MTGNQNSRAKSERNAEIIRRVSAGRGAVSLQSLATEYHLTRARIQHIVGSAGISMREMQRAARKPAQSTCGLCHVLYLKGAYAEHCKASGHRRLTPPSEKVERNLEIVDLYVIGKYNTAEIARYFAIPQPIVSRILHRYGIWTVGRRSAKGGLVRDDHAAAVG